MADINGEQSPLLAPSGHQSHSQPDLTASIQSSSSQDGPAELTEGHSAPEVQEPIEPGELWHHYEVHRRSANNHINEYLKWRAEVLRSSATTPQSQELSAPNQATPSREAWRLKVARDFSVKDLLFMGSALEAIRKTHRPPTAATCWTLLCLGALFFPPTDRATAVISAVGACIGFIGLGRHYLRSFALVTCQARVKHLTGLVKVDQIDESHRDSLSSWPFKLLDTYRIRR